MKHNINTATILAKHTKEDETGAIYVTTSGRYFLVCSDRENLAERTDALDKEEVVLWLFEKGFFNVLRRFFPEYNHITSELRRGRDVEVKTVW